jgi:hypothetical protein
VVRNVTLVDPVYVDFVNICKVPSCTQMYKITELQETATNPLKQHLCIRHEPIYRSSNRVRLSGLR